MPSLSQLAKAVVEGVGITFNSPDALFGGIWIDCTVRERHRFSSEVTDHPVETGTNVADHVHANPDEVELECVISNKPIRAPKSHADGAQEVSKKISLPPQPAKLPLGLGTAAVRVGPLGELAIKESREATVRAFSPEFDRVESVFNELRAMQAEGRVVNVHTSLIDYPDMVITEVDIPRDASTAHSLRFTIGFRQIGTVESKVLRASPIPKMERGKPSVSKGRQSATEAAPGNASAEAASDGTTDSWAAGALRIP